MKTYIITFSKNFLLHIKDVVKAPGFVKKFYPAVKFTLSEIIIHSGRIGLRISVKAKHVYPSLLVR